MKTNHRKLIGGICVMGTSVFYGMVPSLSFLAFGEGVATETLLFNKFLYASILIWSYILIRKLPVRVPPEGRRTLIIVVLSYIAMASMMYLSFNYISGSLATIISFTYPAMVVAVEMIRGAEPVQVRKIIAVLFALAGAVLVISSPDMEIHILGVLFAFACAVSYVFYTIGLSSRKLKGGHPITTAGYVLVASAIFNLGRCAFSGEPMFTSSLAQFKYMIILSVLCAFIAIALFCYGVQLIGASNASIINTFEPFYACLFGYFLVGDQLTAHMIFGGMLIIAAILIIHLPARPERLQS